MNETDSRESNSRNDLNENSSQDSQVQMIFSVDSPHQIQYPPQTWYQKNADVVFPLVIIGIGLFQYVLRKWILPVDKDLIFDLEDQSPGYGIVLHPGFGAFIMIAGVTMLMLFNLDQIF
jgi:hypothetical protein